MRKTVTSSKVKQRYNEKVYRQVSAQLKKQLVADWEAQLAKDGITKAGFIRDAILRYLGDAGDAGGGG